MPNTKEEVKGRKHPFFDHKIQVILDDIEKDSMRRDQSAWGEWYTYLLPRWRWIASEHIEKLLSQAR